jgi:hypothetical protein
VDDFELEALREHLTALAYEKELEAAHHREFIPGGYPAPAPVRHALSAAVAHGYAAALRGVLEEIT